MKKKTKVEVSKETKVSELKNLLATKVGGLFDRDPGSINGNLDLLVSEIINLFN